jgi:hypothetical protein
MIRILLQGNSLRLSSEKVCRLQLQTRQGNGMEIACQFKLSENRSKEDRQLLPQMSGIVQRLAGLS